MVLIYKLAYDISIRIRTLGPVTEIDKEDTVLALARELGVLWENLRECSRIQRRNTVFFARTYQAFLRRDPTVVSLETNISAIVQRWLVDVSKNKLYAVVEMLTIVKRELPQEDRYPMLLAVCKNSKASQRRHNMCFTFVHACVQVHIISMYVYVIK